MKNLKFLMMPALFCACLLTTSAIQADKQVEKLHAASNVLRDFDKADETIPHDMITESQGIIIIPKLLNGGLIVGGKRGRGIAVVKLGDGKWSDPVFITLTGGSLGPQIGFQSVDLVLVFKNKGVLAKVKDGDVTIGGDLSAAAGPVSRNHSAHTDYKMEAEVYSYTHNNKGLFAGVTINGTSLAIDKDANSAFYGSAMTSQEIFADAKSTSPAVKTLKDSLNAL